MNKEWLSQIAELFSPLANVALYEDGEWKEIPNQPRTSKKPPSEERGIFYDGERRAKVLRLPTEKGFIEISFNKAPLYALSEALSPFLEDEEISEAPSPRKQIQSAVHHWLSSQKTTLERATRSDKRQIVLKLYKMGLFQIKDSSKIIAEILQTSRSTIYNYLSWAQTVKKIQIHQVDAFTDVQFEGNPAGVVLDAAELSEEMMRKITREMNLSETAFVLPSDRADFRLRYFTPSGAEVIFCGHSTVSALHMIVHDKPPGHYTFNVETNAGFLHMEATVGEDEKIQVAYETPVIRMQPSSFTHQEIAAALGIPLETINSDLPLMWEETNRDLFIPIQALKELQEIQVDVHKAAEFSKKYGIVAFCLLTNETLESENSAHIRCYAPAVGIPEDPFTGSVQGGLAVYLTQNQLVPPGDMTIEQGHELGRPGSVRIVLHQNTAMVYARAIHFFSTEIDLI